MSKRIAVVLFNLGGPDSLEAVQPFLENLFNDPDIFKLPFQKYLAKFISKRRAPKVAKEYAEIGGKSPIGQWTEIQRGNLEKKLNADLSMDGNRFSVFAAMRYWNPLSAETAAQVYSGKYNRILLLPLYPHFSVSTTGSSYNEWLRHFSVKQNTGELIRNYHCHPGYIDALNERIEEGIRKFPPEVQAKVQLVFSAHGTPVSYVKKGDPYSHQIRETVEAVMKVRGKSLEYHLCFQSKVGPAKWLEPSTDDMIRSLASQEKKHLLIIPVSFVSDHVETLFELDIEYRHVADEAGIMTYVVMRGLNESEKFIAALADIITERLRE